MAAGQRYPALVAGFRRDREMLDEPALTALPELAGTGTDPKGRFNLTVRMSYDEGKTWPVAKTIKNGPGVYSSMTILPDGTIGILCETGNSHTGSANPYARLVLARFNLEWLTNGKDHLARATGQPRR